MKLMSANPPTGLTGPKRLIDEAGMVWYDQDPRVARHLSARLGGAALIDFAVQNLGWIEIGEASDSLKVRCRPRLVTDRALAELLALLYYGAPTRVFLSVLGREWQQTIHRSPDEVTAIVAGMAQARDAVPPRQAAPFMRREIASETSPLMARVRTLLAHASNARSIDELVTPMSGLFNGRWTVSHADREHGCVIIDRVGPGFTPYNPAWPIRPGDTSLNGYAGCAYARWVDDMRAHVARLRVPQFDNVDAIVDFPRLGKTRLRYTRATFPVNLRDGSDFVVAAAKSDSAINLRHQA